MSGLPDVVTIAVAIAIAFVRRFASKCSMHVRILGRRATSGARDDFPGARWLVGYGWSVAGAGPVSRTIVPDSAHNRDAPINGTITKIKKKSA